MVLGFFGLGAEGGGVEETVSAEARSALRAKRRSSTSASKASRRRALRRSRALCLKHLMIEFNVKLPELSDPDINTCSFPEESPHPFGELAQFPRNATRLGASGCPP